MTTPLVSIDMHKVIEYINSSCDIGDEYKRLFGRDMPSSKFSCPNPEHVHSNNTPSCKRYGNAFKCFGQCNRVFGVYDLLKWYDPKRIDELKSKVIITVQPRNQKKQIEKVDVNTTSIVEALKEITGICL